MLPEEVGLFEGLEVCARYFTSSSDTEVGGDFYDVVRLGTSRIALVVGDVQGHDLVAITTMAKVRNGLRAFLQTMHDPDEVLWALDRFVADQPERRFVTIALAFLDTETGDLEVAVAGHPGPILVSEKIEAMQCLPGPPAGVARALGHQGYQVTRSQLPSGAALVFYTDGLVECRSGGCDARLPQLLEAIDRHRGSALQQACDSIIQETLAGASPGDDVAVLWAART
jgi:serine phosphatase RsbU (regulator of sigma subunit)